MGILTCSFINIRFISWVFFMFSLSIKKYFTSNFLSYNHTVMLKIQKYLNVFITFEENDTEN